MTSAGGEVFEIDRRIGWGDCDPAGILYTPNAGRLAMETLDTFFAEAVGVSFAELPQAHGMGAPVLNLAVDFKVRLPADTRVRMVLRVARIGRSSVTYAIDCRSADGATTHFEAALTHCFLALAERKTTPPPDTIRDRLQRFAATTPA